MTANPLSCDRRSATTVHRSPFSGYRDILQGQGVPSERTLPIAPRSLVRVLTEARVGRLDIGPGGHSSGRIEESDAHSTTFTLRRRDGPSVGPVSTRHVVGIFCEHGCHRFDLGARRFKPQAQARQRAKRALSWRAYVRSRIAFPAQARPEDWTLINAGQRVQARDPPHL